MRKRSKLSVSTMIATCMTVITLFGTSPVYAETTDNVIDLDMKGSITLHKVIENDGQVTEDDAIINEEETRKPVDKIGFSYKRIADIVQVAGRVVYYENDPSNAKLNNDITDVFFTNLDDSFKQAIEDALGDDYDESIWERHVEIEGDESVYYTPDEIEYFLNIANHATGDPDALSNAYTGETKLTEYLRTNGTEMPKTNAAGATTISDLDTGLYLVAETDISAHDGLKADGTQYKQSPNPEAPVVESIQSPFLVSVPTTNIIELNEKSEGTQWMYDLDIYPKDSSNAISKRIVDPDETEDRALRTREDYQVGDVIEQIIYADAPKLQSYTSDNETYTNTHKKFVITDTMTTGLTVDKITEVAICNKVEKPLKNTDFTNENNNYRILTEDDDYTVEGIGTQKFTVTLTTAGLRKLDSIRRNSQVVVSFKSTLNGNAKIGEVIENENHPTLTWRNSNSLERSYEGNPVKVFTYGLEIKKDGLANASHAGFKFQRHDTFGEHQDNGTDTGFQNPLTAGTTNVLFVKISDGVYRVYDKNEYTHVDQNVTTTDVVYPATNGSLSVSGLDSNRYTILEAQTENGKNLLGTSFDVLLVAPNPGANDVPGDDGIFTTDRNGKLDENNSLVSVLDKQTSATTRVKIQMRDDNKGIAKMTVNNYKGISLFSGGRGKTYLYWMAGGLAAVLIVLELKQKSAGSQKKAA